MTRFQLPKLPFKKVDLASFLSSEAIDYHYLGHHQAYVKKVNEFVQKMALEDVTLENLIQNYDGAIYDNAAQAWNHTFFWCGLAAEGQRILQDGPLMQAIFSRYGSLDGLKTKFIESATSLFGSGWTWIVATEKGDIEVMNTHNGDNPMRSENRIPLWTCDIWEHAYYVDYRNIRRDYLEKAWSHANWSFVEQNFGQKYVPNMTKLMIASEIPVKDQPSPRP